MSGQGNLEGLNLGRLPKSWMSAWLPESMVTLSAGWPTSWLV